MKLKVCGMKYKDNIQAVAELQPDYLGFIFWEKSSRYLEGSIPKIPAGIKKVGVFVDETIENVISTIKKHELQAVQLHGKEAVVYCIELRKRLTSDRPIEIFKVFSIKDDFDFSVLEEFETYVDYFLFDTKGKLPGGNGYNFDWKVLENYPSKKPFLLSGGIGLEEIEKVKEILVSNLPIHAIDVNSKFEIEAGLKDERKVKIFKDHLLENKT